MDSGRPTINPPATQVTAIAPAHSDEASALAYALVDADSFFQNISVAWHGAMADIATAAGNDALQTIAILRQPHHPIWVELRRKYGPLPAGILVDDEYVHSETRTVFILASKAYDYLRPELRDRLRIGADPHLPPVDESNRTSTAECARFFAERSLHEGPWQTYFDEERSLGDHRSYFFVCATQEFDTFIKDLQPPEDDSGHVAFRTVGKPEFGPPQSQLDRDYVVRFDFRNLDHELCVPCTIDAQAYEFFLPNGQCSPRRGRTVFVAYAPPCQIRDGIAEWTHKKVTFKDHLLQISPVGPVTWIGKPRIAPRDLMHLLSTRRSADRR